MANLADTLSTWSTNLLIMLIALVIWTIFYFAWLEPRLRAGLSRLLGHEIGLYHLYWVVWKFYRDDHNELVQGALWILGLACGLLVLTICTTPLVLLAMLLW